MPKTLSSNLLKKAFDFISRLTHSREIGLLIVFILLGAVSLTVIVAQQQQQIRQRAAAPLTCIGVGSYSTESDCSAYCTVKVYDYKRCVSINSAWNSAWTCQNCKNVDGYTPSSTPIPAPTSTIKPTVTPACVPFACAGDCLAYDSSCNKISADDCCGVQAPTPTKTPTPTPPVSCGASGQACCGGNVCNPGLICQFGGCDPFPVSTSTRTPIPTPTKTPTPTATRTLTPTKNPTPTSTLPPGAVPTSTPIIHVTIYGKHLDENGNPLTKNIGQSVSLSNGLADTTSLGAWDFSGIRSGTYTVTAKLISGYTIYNSFCEGCHIRFGSSYKQGNTVTLTLPSPTGRISTIADIYFKYIPILTSTLIPTQKPITITSSPTVSYCSLKNQGDANCDGKINILDFNLWKNEFLSELEEKTTKRDSDFNKDNLVTILDFNIWRTGFLINN